MTTTVALLAMSGLPASAAVPSAPNTWTLTATMATARAGQTQTLLQDGRVLVAGGGTSAAEIFDPAAGTWSTAGSMSVARTNATATSLPGGRVLVAGGCCDTGGVGLASAELYDPATNAWKLTGTMTIGRTGHTAVLLGGGQVLVAGGACRYGCTNQSFFSTLRSAELYDTASGKWTATGSMSDPRESHTATLLANGKVLVTGGLSGCDDSFCSDNASAELYDPTLGKWTKTGHMVSHRERHTATLLSSGQVLVAGGLDQGGFGSSSTFTSAERYDPGLGSWHATASMSLVHIDHTSTLLSDGTLLVAGGGTATAELFEPGRSLWVSPGKMSTARTAAPATRLVNGSVLVTGGYGPGGAPLATAEIYVPGPGPLVRVTPLSLSFQPQRVGNLSRPLSFTIVNDGTAKLSVRRIEVTGQDPGDFVANSDCVVAPVRPGRSCTIAVRFRPTATGIRSAVVSAVDNAPLSPQGAAVSGFGGGPDAWVPTGSMNGARDEAAVSLLPSGKVLVAGGENASSFNLGDAQLWDPATGIWSPTASMITGRSFATATLLNDGRVLVVGGLGSNFTNLASAELYNPASGTWAPTGSMSAGRHGHTATLLGDGKVLVAGGVGTDAELYDPTNGTWTLTGPMTVARDFASATLLTSGNVLVAGGDDIGTAELYDPSSRTWSATGPINVERFHQASILLKDGRVLIEGGDPHGGGTPLASAELYDPVTATWTLTGSMQAGRYSDTATLLPSGLVLATGGCTSFCNPNTLASAELYDPATGTWTPTASMTSPRVYQSATLLSDGSVLVAGGSSSGCCTYTATSELYTPALLDVSPTRGEAGQSLSISGRNFFSREPIAVYWDNTGTTRLATAATSPDGSFFATAAVPNAKVGMHTLIAIGGRSGARARAVFTVDP